MQRELFKLFFILFFPLLRQREKVPIAEKKTSEVRHMQHEYQNQRATSERSLVKKKYTKYFMAREVVESGYCSVCIYICISWKRVQQINAPNNYESCVSGPPKNTYVYIYVI